MAKKILTLLIFVILCASVMNLALASDPLNPDDSDSDADKDGLVMWEEYLNGTDPNNADSDNDGLPDGWEVFNNLDPTNPNDARQDMDYQVPDQGTGIAGEIDAKFTAVRNSFDVWPSDGITQVAADLKYDNYEEYYRAFTYMAGTKITPETHPYGMELPPGGEWVIFSYTDPQEPDTDGDTLLDPDDLEPHNFANDGTSYKNEISPEQIELINKGAEPYATTQKYRTADAMDTFQTHDSVMIDTELFASIKF
ncbi:MAG: hypothetical protein JSV49_12055 [Thermoplasmata archaeon]|nr:MAG: hypothetical protein JSV49_12055 [Thermoplasmata archaeon]